MTGSTDGPWGEAGWPFRRIEVRCLRVLEDQPLSVSRLAAKAGHSRKAVRDALDRLAALALVEEVDGACGPHRMHRLTESGRDVSIGVADVVDELDGRGDGTGDGSTTEGWEP